MGAEPVKDMFSHTMDAAGHAARKIFPIVLRQAAAEIRAALTAHCYECMMAMR